MQEDRQTTEVRQTNEQVGNTTVQRESVAKSTAVSGVVIAQRVIYYVGGVIIALLLVRVLLQLLGANQGSDFVGFIYALSSIFVAPFSGIFGEPTFGQSHFETSAIVAIIVYALLTVGIAKLIALTRPREEV
ncbi:MAG: Membrane protein involved in colicin uptake [Candidatus Saccharibacteria bacterium]|nr:Membrane protein involved in colicin uptake [Candidatus Saccharibacteria bacterium]MDB5180787.1 Membrane protein involved in colicin uptake [Candidatus Saccharibacteria bacterium]MDB5180792.1 Membrane protein involved in colicin uptake [Candidatus Saccharibacteria bacterium]